MLDAFAAPGRFRRGNLHGHSIASDGAWTPEAVCRGYREQGYDFTCLSDHFREAYGFPVTDTTAHRMDGFTTLIGAEVHAPRTTRGVDWHVLAVGLPFDFAPTGPEETGVALARRCREAGAFVAIAHPHWYNLELSDALALDAAHAVEVHNHTCALRTGRGDGGATWDGLLSAGRRVGGIAVDDSHFRGGAFDGFGGWVMVKAEENEPGALLEALRAGRFYASTGPLIEDVRREGDALEIRCSAAVQVLAVGPVAASAHAIGPALTRARLPLEPFAGAWCRVSVRDAAGRTAWTNPLWLD